ncbi:MAG: right-handed parallel beta-helix repeat-containing protein [Myxococcota bacterium]
MNSRNKKYTLTGIGIVIMATGCGGMEDGAREMPASQVNGPAVAVDLDDLMPTPTLCPGFADACFFVTNTDPGVVPGSFAQAIQDANGAALGGSQTTMIVFDIPGAGAQVIDVDSPLPPIIGPGIIVNGLSQPGAAPSTDDEAATVQVVLDGSSFPTNPVQPGILVTGDSNVIKGLGVQNFSGAGILVRGSHNVVRDNRIGVDAAGQAQPNAGSGVDIREVTFANRVEDNLIDANDEHGVSVLRSEGTVIRENAIGATWDRQVGEGNGGSGVWLDRSSHTRVGGGTDEANFIAGNGENGITVVGDGAANRFESNGIWDNKYLGIDLGNDGVTPNDVGDKDEGPNTLVNTPVITGVTLDPKSGRYVVDYAMEGPVNEQNRYHVEFFASPRCRRLSAGGQIDVGRSTIQVNGPGFATGSYELPGSAQVGPRSFITATAIIWNEGRTSFDPDVEGSTSEFSACYPVP